MLITITPSPLSGPLTPPPSKSQGHRALICASLAPGESTIEPLSPSQDLLATADCLRALGGELTLEGDTARVRGLAAGGPLPFLPCRESGSTLRFLLPLALVLRGGGVFIGAESLFRRPMEPYRDLCSRRGILYEQRSEGLTVRGLLRPGRFEVPGDISSQFVSGLLFALPLLDGDSELILTTPLESAGYVDMTLDALHRFGIEIFPTQNGWRVPGNQTFRPRAFTVEADWSQAAFFLAANALGSRVELSGLRQDSLQGDARFLSCSERLKAPGPVDLDISQIPDLLPALAVQAALRAGERTVFTHAGRLRLKESDRLESVSRELNLLGGRCSVGPDFMTIDGVSTFSGGTVESHGDHRVAMMLAVAATRASGPVTLRGAECVSKSYPAFWEDYASLGGNIEEVF